MSAVGNVAGKMLLIILKWGGEVTPDGEQQAEDFGTAFRCIYPDGEGEYASLPGSGFLRLHSTYRHDLKVYASDEGRVQTTAAAFTKVRILIGNLHRYNIVNSHRDYWTLMAVWSPYSFT